MTTTSDRTSFQSIIKMLDSLSSTGNYDTMINVLALLCLFSILNKGTVSQASAGSIGAPAAAGAGGNPLQKILGELTKGDGGGLGGGLGGALGAALGSPDMLMSLLPLLNNPQIKSKINPANIASVMGMINNLGGAGNNEKPEPAKAKPEKPEKKATVLEPTVAPPIEQTLKTAAEPLVAKSIEAPSPEEQVKKVSNRFLNWKTNF